MRFVVGMNTAGRTSDVQPSAGGLVVDHRGQQVLRRRARPPPRRASGRRPGSRAWPALRTRSTTSDHGRRLLDAEDVDARHHDLAHVGVAEREDAGEQVLLLTRDVGLGRDHLPELLGADLALAGVLRLPRHQAQHERIRVLARSTRRREHQLGTRTERTHALRAPAGRARRPSRRGGLREHDRDQRHADREEDRLAGGRAATSTPTASAAAGHELREHARERQGAMRALALAEIRVGGGRVLHDSTAASAITASAARPQGGEPHAQCDSVHACWDERKRARILSCRVHIGDAVRWSSDGWSWPSTWSVPCTTSRAISSRTPDPCARAFSRATSGAM
jgi:hypothetical protein